MKTTIRTLALVAAVLLVGFAAVPAAGAQGKTGLEKEVRHELLMLPYYTVFDDLSYEIQGNTVVLSGAVTRPTLKSDAENVVKKIEGVGNVVNNIRVLPASPMDDRIRRAVHHSLYGWGSPLFRYGVGALQSIHIIVENGNVTLVGYVNSEADKNLANIRTNEVPGVFSVTNNLKVQK